MNGSVFEGIVATPYIELFDQTQIVLILITFFVLLMLFLQMDFGTVILYSLVISTALLMPFALSFGLSLGVVNLVLLLFAAIIVVMGILKVIK